MGMVPRMNEVPCGMTGAWVLCLSCAVTAVCIGLFLVREKWDMFMMAIALNVCFVLYYVLWRVCGWSCATVKRAFEEMQMQRKQDKEMRLLDENEEFRRAISDTI